MQNEKWVELAAEMERRAEARLAETPGDPAGQVSAYWAKRVRETIAADTSETWLSTVAAVQMAREHGFDVALSTVQYWCRNADRLGVRVMQSAGGPYRIHRDDVIRSAQRKARRKSRRKAA